MVSLFYYEKRGFPCLKVLYKLGRSVKMLLFPTTDGQQLHQMYPGKLNYPDGTRIDARLVRLVPQERK